MPMNYLTLQDGDTDLRQPNGDVDFSIDFDAPGLNTDPHPVVSYRITPFGGSVTLHIDLNGTLIVNDTFQSTSTRSLNEILPHGVAQEQGNTLTVTRQAGPGDFKISDILFFYSQD